MEIKTPNFFNCSSPCFSPSACSLCCVRLYELSAPKDKPQFGSSRNKQEKSACNTQYLIKEAF